MQFSFHQLFENRHRLGLLAETVIEDQTTCQSCYSTMKYLGLCRAQIYLEKMIWNNVIDFSVSS